MMIKSCLNFKPCKKIEINVLEQPSHEPSILASVNSGHICVRKKREGREGREGREEREGRDGGTLENDSYEIMRERRHQTARELKDVNSNVIATFQMSLQ